MTEPTRERRVLDDPALRDPGAERLDLGRRRRVTAFEVLIEGGRGTGGMYGFVQKLRAIASGKPAALDHTPRSRASNADAEIEP